MKRVAIALGLTLALTAPAAAEDFTGFYAGVNAGFATGADRSGGPPAFAPRQPPGPAALPPSASAAAASVRRPSRSAPVPRGAVQP